MGTSEDPGPELTCLPFLPAPTKKIINDKRNLTSVVTNGATIIIFM
jgi:hypothetical protein